MFSFLYYGESLPLSKYLRRECEFISYASYKELIKKRDVKVNGNRIGAREDVLLKSGDEVVIYLNLPVLKEIFSDLNILIIDKPAKMKSTEGDFCALSLAQKQFGNCLAVHRLDTNTEGLLMFARNESALLALKKASANGQILKYYYACVAGEPQNECELIAYLKKGEGAKVQISRNKAEGFVPIKTSYKLIEKNSQFSTLQVLINRGQTHQIRAHLAFEGLPIIGDTKYGDFDLNRKLNKSVQQLSAERIKFSKLTGELEYLSGKEFKR